MPVVILDDVEAAPPELAAQIPARAELLKVLPGPDRPDYCLALLENRTIFRPPEGFDASTIEPEFLRHDDDGTPVILVYAVVMCSRFAGQQIAPDMKDLWVNLAFITDNSLLRDDRLDFAKIAPVGVVRINLDPTTESFRRR
ncbi:hypothetical protein [Lolliginicoccus suaedae]|uniref:hypothetical protein n=1 Tax=Lolliginicoccus suaedae TaxID=2605429 RepID=UPI0011EE9AA7|nr:hypothetical protein [Lolliginicoccus suaedae]